MGPSHHRKSLEHLWWRSERSAAWRVSWDEAGSTMYLAQRPLTSKTRRQVRAYLRRSCVR